MLRPNQQRPPAKKITRETLRNNPLLLALARQRAQEIRQLQEEKKAGELKLEGGGPGRDG